MGNEAKNLGFHLRTALCLPYPQMSVWGHTGLIENTDRLLPVRTREFCILRAALRVLRSSCHFYNSWQI